MPSHTEIFYAHNVILENNQYVSGAVTILSNLSCYTKPLKECLR